MPDLRRPNVLLYVLAGVLVVVAGGRWVRSGERPSSAPPPASAGRSEQGVRVEQAGGGDAVVHVAGEVRAPGVYRLGAGTRVEEALRRAGGPTRHADLNAINLAAKVEDGRQVVVPRRAGAPAAGGAAPAPAGGEAAAPTVPVNLNTATAEELGTLDGVGPATAQKILVYRQEHGGFGSVDELDQVPGIGEKRLAALREHVTV
jgi:competence protein ComEA